MLRGRFTGVLAKLTGLVLVFLVSAELTARIEDFVLWDTPVWASPDHNRDLILQDHLGVRGRPNGQFKKWRLNNFGFRSGPMSLLPEPGVTRVMVLGASETFGLFERDGFEYPAQLGLQLERRGRFEVVNAAVAGLSVIGLCQLWDQWVVRFKPAVVVVYPTPSFYLDNLPPHRPSGRSPAREQWSPPQLRLLDALKDRFEVPARLQRIRLARKMAAVEASHPRDWPFRTLPSTRLTQFSEDLGTLLDSIKAAGAQPILMTHAVGFHEPLTPSESYEADAWRSLTPRATAGVLVEFDFAAADAERAVATAHGVTVVDLAGRIGSDPRFFAEDLHHFNEDGAREAASLLADAILRIDPPARPRR